MNPYPCGYYGDSIKEFANSLAQLHRYRYRICGPQLDRKDVHLEMPRGDYEELSGDRCGELSAKTREHVERARDETRTFYRNEFAWQWGYGLRRSTPFSKRMTRGRIFSRGDATAAFRRGTFRILKLARTIADLTETEKIETAHITEAI